MAAAVTQAAIEMMGFMNADCTCRRRDQGLQQGVAKDARLLPIERDGERGYAFCDHADVVADPLDLDVGVAAIVFVASGDPMNLTTLP